MAFFLFGNLCRKIAISYILYSYQLNLVAPPNKIFGIQEEAMEKIKQEETKVLVYLSKLHKFICPNWKILSASLLAQILPSPIQTDKSADVFVLIAK